MPYTVEPPPTRLHIWKQNLNKSDKAHYDLINTPLHKNWDILALQELYIDTLGNTKVNSQWHVVYPLLHLTNSTTCQNSVLKGKILSKRSGKSVDKFRGSEWSALKSNPSGSGKPIVEGVGLKVQPAEMQAVPFR